ncbi:MAG: nucleotidyl transferase AbiEii/AbiGii toxin family protein [Planctomycetes bacterium]|nr:nucleotidyl transferase AbiEii/AbiGii toxin family protein [Planctomycetota bacterium]
MLTYSPTEPLGTKLRALYRRKKGRDLFDLRQALTQLPVDDAGVVLVFGEYMERAGLPVTRRNSSAIWRRGSVCPSSSAMCCRSCRATAPTNPRRRCPSSGIASTSAYPASRGARRQTRSPDQRSDRRHQAAPGGSWPGTSPYGQRIWSTTPLDSRSSRRAWRAPAAGIRSAT